VLHDCDKAGFEILDKFRSDTRRHTYAIQPTVEDLGLRLADAQAMVLPSERVYYQGQKDPRESLRRCGATPEECAFLVQRRVGEGWEGERIELNAMDSVTFITWLEAKLVAAGVRKLVPEGEALTAAYQRMTLIAMLQRALDTALASLPAPDTIPVPTGLAETISAAITNTADPWDEALWKSVCALRIPAGKCR
jgi:hypothetical protein